MNYQQTVCRERESTAYFSLLENQETEVYRVYLHKNTKMLDKSNPALSLFLWANTLNQPDCCFHYWHQCTCQGKVTGEE